MFKKFVAALLVVAASLTFQMVSVAAGSANKFEDLKNPHNGFFYIITKPVEVNIKQQMERAYNLIIEGKDYDMAIAVLNEVIKLNPENSEAYILRGMAHTELKEYDKADKEYLSAVKLESENPTFYYYRAINRLYQGYANRNGRSIVSIGADNRGIWADSYDIWAVRDFKKAIELAPYYVDAIVGLGDCYCSIAEKNNNETEKRYAYRSAIGEYNKILVLFPDHNIVLTKKEDAQRAMEKIEK
ncbi:MAG: hypothetical protein IJ862_02225 [Selenomonadaceae bacterium]|nr:hypothetical protein [Selenomonadaceae bacterium]